MTMFSKLNKFFSSVKLALFLLISIAILSMIGTFINQGQSMSQYKVVFGAKAFAILYWLGFLNIYNSWYFIALSVLLAINLITASANSLPYALKSVFGPYPSFGEISAKKNPKAAYENFTTKKNHGEIVSILNSVFGKPATEKATESENGTGATDVYYSKNAIFRLSPYIAHLSILIIMAGVILNVTYGFRSFARINEGAKTNVAYFVGNGKPVKLPFTITLDKYRTYYYPNGMPKAYVSTLGIIENHVRVLTGKIKVNHPLTYKGITIYQASYGTYKPNQYGILVADFKNVKNKKMIFAQTGKYYDAGINGVKFELKKNPESPQNPYYIKLADGKILYFKIFRLRNSNFPFIVARNKNTVFVFTPEVKTFYYSGMQITRNSYTSVIWFGSIILIASLFFSFFFNHTETWVRISESEPGKNGGNKGKNKVEIIGVPKKKFESFYKSFNKKTAAVKRKLL